MNNAVGAAAMVLGLVCTLSVLPALAQEEPRTQQDNGGGIPPEYMSNIYERFSQAIMTPTRPHGRVGLGLTNVKRLVDLMGGTIEAISTVGIGATFAIDLSLPFTARKPASDVTLLSSSVELTPTSHEGRVLLVEDNPLNQKTACRMLTRLGFLVTMAHSGRETLAVMENEVFDLVLMDVQMSDMDGYETIQALRAREAGTDRHVPVIAMTTFVMKGDREKCLAAGMDDYLGKPVKMADLAFLLNKWRRDEFRDPMVLQQSGEFQASHNYQSKCPVREDRP